MNNDEIELLSDSKYRQFINAVDKALKNFEYSSEWADLISALGKLNKVLLLHQKFKVVPRKILISKRLSQCMHPNLPSGVHLKALETYELIFRRLGNKGLSQDLFIYSSGLFPLLGNGAMSVKPVLMGIYEEFYVSLGKALIPCLPGLLLGLLPGIEEGSEYTNRTMSILESISQKTDMTTFYGTLWYCVLSVTSVRLPAVTFIMTRLNKKAATKQDYILGNDIPMMVQAVSLALADPNVLVQRVLLDFLLAFLPMNCDLVSSSQKVKLVAAGLSSLLRRDMSLNRRLYTWLLGPEDSKLLARADSVSSEQEDQTKETYFNVYSKPSTVEALRVLFQKHYTSMSIRSSSSSKKSSKNEALWPFRILISLLDRPEIGSTILEDVLIEVYRLLYFRCRAMKKKDSNDELEKKDSDEALLSDDETSDSSSKSKISDDLIKTANLLFNAFEPYFMWDYVCKLLSVSYVEEQQKDDSSEKQDVGNDSKIPSTSFSEVLRLTDFLLDVVALEADVETQTEHWPRLLCHVTMEMTSRCQSLSLVEISEGISLCSKLLSKVMPSMTSLDKYRNGSHVSDIDNDRLSKNDELKTAMNDQRVENNGATSTGYSSSENLSDIKQDGSDSPQNGSKGRIIHVARISAGDDGWSVVDLRKRLENVNDNVADQQSHDEDNEMTESGEAEADDEILGKDSNENQINAEKNENQECESGSEEMKNEIVKEEESESYDEWSECQDDVTEAALKSASGVSDLSQPTHTSPKIASSLFQPSLVQSCVHYFQSFFSEFVNQRIVTSECLSYNEKPVPSSRRNSEIILEQLLSKTSEKQTCEQTQENMADLNDVISGRGLDIQLPWEQENYLLCAEAFSAACKLLVELSCFPVYCTNDSMHLDPNQVESDSQCHLPEWLQGLIVCCFRVKYFDVQSSAVGTLLDLVNLTLSVSPHSENERPKSTIVVVVIPMISHANLNTIEQSCIYKVIAESLWSQLQHNSSRYHQRIVELFLQLHSLTPRPSLCENVITNLLIHDEKESRLDNHWKFAVFWHAARNVVIQDSGRTPRLGDVRPLDRALFIMFDGLESDDPEIRVLTRQWLAHALQHGDLGRLLDPLLMLLLHPATARLSVHHACSLEQKVKSADKSNTQDPTKDNRKAELMDDLRTTSATSGSEFERAAESDRDDGKNNITQTPRKPTKSSTKNKDAATQQQITNKQKSTTDKSLVHPLDQHKLVYRLIYDGHLTLYAFNTLLSVLRSAPHQFVCAAATFSVSSSNTPHQDKIKVLLARHRKSLLGKGFYGPLQDTPLSPSGKQKSFRLFAGSLLYLRPNTSKYLEILIAISLYFIRSEYPDGLYLDSVDIDGNTEVQMISADVLTSTIWQLVEVVRENAVGIGPFINDLFTRCKVQKALLHCLLSTLYERTGSNLPSTNDKNEQLPPRVSTAAKPSQLRAFQVKLLKLVQAIFVLEDNIEAVELGTPEHLGAHPRSPAKSDNEAFLLTHNHVYRYHPGKTLAYQSMLLSAVMHGLENDDYDLHHEWLRFVIACLPHMKGALSTWVMLVVQQVARMLQAQTGVYVPLAKTEPGVLPPSSVRTAPTSQASLPPDYILTLLEDLSTICHFCLVDLMPTSPGLSLKPRTAPFPATTGGASAAESSQSSSSQIFANLIHAFSNQSSIVNQITSAEGPKPFLEARENLLSILPSVLTALISVWSAWNPDAHESTGQRLPSESYMDLIGSPKSVRLQVLQLLTPIVMNHTIVFLASLADVWHQRGKRGRQSSNKPAGPVVTRATDEQAAIVDIVYALKALSFDNTIETVKQIVRQVTTSKDKSTATQSGLEVHILQFFYHYVDKSSHNQLINARPALISLMKEGLQLNQPPALFLLLVILRSYVQRIPLQEDKKAKKELQDITQRLIEACNIVAGSSLENAAWFRRSIAVIPQIDTTASESTDQFTESEVSDSEPALEPILLAKAISSSSSHYSTQALSVMSEVLAPLLDVVFGSEEKDRVTSLLTTVMYNITPYLKYHSPSNIPNFRACCAVVASLSGYQYMRRAWKRDVMEQVMDNNFFQMDITCIGSWRTIMDNLMTQDSTSFKDLMARVAGFSQSAAINIFANREQEMEQRAHLLKKLAFVLFCSETDQYHYCLPEIQERLAECIRLPQAPVLHEQVFLALRVLLLRMSPEHLTSLWPVIISEIVHAMLQLESDVSNDDKTHDQRMLMSETLLGSNGYVNYSQEKWLGLYLAAFKLLDLTLSLPGDRLSQFQMYRWAFEGGETNCSSAMTTKSGNGDNKTEKVTIFRPHISRIWKLLRKRCRRPEDITELQRTPGRPLLTMYQIKSLDQLLPFLKCLSKPNRSEIESEDWKAKGSSQGVLLFERIVERDFLESLIAD